MKPAPPKLLLVHDLVFVDGKGEHLECLHTCDHNILDIRQWLEFGATDQDGRCRELISIS